MRKSRTHLRSRVEALRAVMERTQEEIALLREYRTRLIADVITGKVDVGEAAGLPEVTSSATRDAVDEVGCADAGSDISKRQVGLDEGGRMNTHAADGTRHRPDSKAYNQPHQRRTL